MALTNKLGGKRKRYNGKKLWEAYMGMGRAASYGKLAEWAKDNGMANPRTGRVNQMGMRWSMWTYAMDYPEQAFPAYKAWALEQQDDLLDAGINPTDENLWRRFLEDVADKNSKGNAVYSKKRYNAFCEKYDLPYQETESPLVAV